eukprot:g11781.t1
MPQLLPDDTSTGTAFTETATASSAPRFISQLRDGADQKVQERESLLARLRCLLFPPESTSSPEQEGGSTPAATPTSGANSSYLSGPLPPVSSPSATSPRMFQGKPQPGSGSTQASHRTSLGPEMSVPEQVGHDLDEEHLTTAAVISKGHRHSDGAKGSSALATAGDANVDPNSDDQALTSTRPRAASGVNYLARMATDTDFVGAPGSVLVDFFPPDTKLYRNPFVLGHNLDDTLAVSPGDAVASPRDRGRQGMVENSRAAPTVQKNSRLDTRRVRLASAAIVAEDARNRSGKRRRAEGWGEQHAPGGVAEESCEGGSSSGQHDGNVLDRADSGGSRVRDDDHGGGDNSSKTKRGKGGIRFQDEHSEDGQGGSDGGHSGASSHAARVGARSDWATIAKAVKEPAYRGPWVPVLLDTNVSCPEGINEVLAEDDVSWQLKPGDRIRIGCCTGHEWEVKGVTVVPNGRGKCRIALTEMYNHAKATTREAAVTAGAPHMRQSQPDEGIATMAGGASGEVPGSSGLRTVHSHSNIKAGAAAAAAAASGHTATPVSSRPVGSSSSAPLLPDASGEAPEVEKENKASDPTAGSLQQPKGLKAPSEGRGGTPVTTPPNGNNNAKNHHGPPPPTPGAIGEAKRQAPKSAAGKKRPGTVRRVGLPTPGSPAMGVSSKRLGAAAMGTSTAGLGSAKRHGGGAGKDPTGSGDNPERHAARNLEIFEQNLAGLSLPKDVAGKGAGGGRRRSLLGGYKAHSEAVRESRRINPDTVTEPQLHDPVEEEDVPAANPRKRSRTHNSVQKSRRLSAAAPESERMPGAELAGGGHGQAKALGGGKGGGGLARCQRVWKMTPPMKYTRPTWLRQYEDGSIAYGSHYQNGAGRRKKEGHFRVRLSWAQLELIVVDRPNTRRFAEFRPKQRYTFFRQLGLDDLLTIAYRETVAASSVPPGTEKAPAELDLKSWHTFVVSLGYIADVSQPARHHDIEQMYRQRTRQYKLELKKLEALAAKERERLLAEERAHARRLAATGEASGGADDQASPSIVLLPPFRLGRVAWYSQKAAEGLQAEKQPAANGQRPPGLSGPRHRAHRLERGADTRPENTPVGLGLSRGIRSQELGMLLRRFKEALTALVLLKQPELEHKGKQDEGLRDLVFNHVLVRPELERVRETAWLQAKVRGHLRKAAAGDDAKAKGVAFNEEKKAAEKRRDVVFIYAYVPSPPRRPEKILENLELVAARLSCRKQRDGRRWVVSRAKRVAAESGSLVHRVASRLDGVLYFFKVFRSATEVAVTAYEPRRCETLRAVLPIRGARGISVWIKWEVEMATIRRKREILRRLGEVQKVLKLHEMNVEIERPKLLAARRLGEAFRQRQLSLSAAAASNEGEGTVDTGMANAARSAKSSRTTNLRKQPPADPGGEDSPLGGVGPISGTSARGLMLASAAPITEAPPVDPKLTGMGALPFALYDGAVPDLELFADGALLETDEVASAPDVDITARGREVTLAKWILRRVKVEKNRVVEVALPSGGGRSGWDGSKDDKKKRAPKSVARWERVLVTFYEVETRRRDLAASRVQGLSRMKKARERARSFIYSQFEKRFDVYSGQFYYHSNKTGVDTFVKPRLLRPDQDLEEPPDEWIEQKDRSGKTFYTNPATGQRSFLSVPEAAGVIVKACRHYLRAFFGVPSADAIERGLQFSREAEDSWTQGGGRLASTLNYALDLDAAGPLYDTALKLSGENPLVQRACGLYLLVSCRFPREQSRSKGLALLSAADYRDRDLNTFALAEGAFYHFGLLSTPTRARALLNWALVLEHVRRDPEQAELFYRRALAANDLDPLVLANYKSFCMERLPGGSYPGGGPGSRVLRRSRLDGERAYAM